jgi:nucleotide-binding universal stress UspA family protein
MISSILIAVDGSAHSMKAVDIGSQIAAALKAGIVLLYVAKEEKFPDAMRQFAKVEHFPDRDADFVEILKRGAEHMLEGAVARARSAGVSDVRIEVEEGPIARTIAAKGDSHDMIVIGSRGMGDLEGLLRGGVSHRVEILAKCPVLVVR